MISNDGLRAHIAVQQRVVHDVPFEMYRFIYINSHGSTTTALFIAMFMISIAKGKAQYL